MDKFEKSQAMHKKLYGVHNSKLYTADDYNTIKKHEILMQYHRNVYNQQRRWGVILNTKEKKKEYKKAERRFN